MMHLFDLKTILLAKHAQHVVVIHFPIALFLMSVIFDAFASLRKNETLRVVAYYNLLAAAITSIIAAGTGLFAWQLIYGGGTPKGVILFHMTAAGVAIALLWLLLALRSKHGREPGHHLSRLYIFLAVLAAIVIMLVGYFGGFLSGVNQVPE